MFRRLACALALSVLVACSSTPASPSHRVITGVVTDIESGKGFGEVESFVVKEDDELHRVYIDDDVAGFPLAHLNAHRAGAEPVRVEAAVRDGRLVAVSIRDA